MDEGSALLHHLERNFNQVATCLVTQGSFAPTIRKPSVKEEICLTGSDPVLLEQVRYRLREIIASWGRGPKLGDLVLAKEDSEDFHEARHVAICVNASSLSYAHVLCYIGRTYRNVRLRKGNILLLLFDDNPTGSVANGNSLQNGREPPSSVYELTENNPELRMLNEKCRVHTIYGGKDRKFTQDDEDVIRLWIQGKLSNDSDNLNHMEYSDLSKIFVRDVKQYLPDVRVFLRLLLMAALGVLSVVATLLVIVLITKAPDVSKDLERAREYLQQYIEAQRSGKCEWGQQYNAIALTALQIADPSWCFDSVDRQRSVDRMEISLLASFSKLGQPSQRELTPMQLGHAINALWATYQNPRHFHDHNLLAILDKYLSQVSPYVEYNGFAYSLCLVALCNAGYPVRHRYWERLVQPQRPDGSFPLGMDETAMVVIALSCAPNASTSGVDVSNAVRRAITYLAVHRLRDGSYGTLYTTALVLQAFTSTGTVPLEQRQHEHTLNWLTWQAQHSPLVKNIDIAAHVLIALAGKTLLSIRTPTESSSKISATLYTTSSTPVPTGKQTDTYKYLTPDPKPGAVGILPTKEEEKEDKDKEDEDVLIEFLDDTEEKSDFESIKINDSDIEETKDADEKTKEETLDLDPDLGDSSINNLDLEKDLKNDLENNNHPHNQQQKTERNEQSAARNERKNHKRDVKLPVGIKKGHMEFRRDRRIDIEELIMEDMENEDYEYDDGNDDDDDDGNDDDGNDDDGNDDKGNKETETDLQAEEKKYRRKVKKMKRKTRIACSCRTMNIFDPLYVLFNMCPVIPVGCP